jgi:MFS family permease
LRHRDFRWFIVSLFTMVVGSQAQAVVVGWQVYALTHDPLSLGLIGLAEALPFIGIALPAGYLADRRNRRSISVAMLLVLALCSVALVALSAIPWSARRALASSPYTSSSSSPASLAASCSRPVRRSARTSSRAVCIRTPSHGAAARGRPPP